MKDSRIKELEFEVEESQENEKISVPYDIATYPSDFTLAGIVEMWKNKDITIPEFQREFVWTIQQSSLLIESFLLGLPVPSVFFYIDEKNKNLVIDGQQRILSIVFYFEGYFGIEGLQGKRKVFRLHGLDERSPYYNKKYDELSEAEQRKLKGTVLRAINIRQLSPSEDNTSIYHIFERLNTGGTPLKSQEIRNVVYRGEIVHCLRELNEDANWRLILGKKNFDKHQRDVELVLRLFALSFYLNKYEKPMKEFLNKIMFRNQSANLSDFKKYMGLFPKATKFIAGKLGNKPFHIRGPLNTSVLDSVFCTILPNFDNLPQNIKTKYEKLIKDEEYSRFTMLATTDVLVVKDRFARARKYLLDD